MALRAHHQSRCLTGRSSRARFAAVPVPVRGRPTGRRAAVVVQANLFARVSRLLKSYANNVVSAQEDPEKLLDQVVTEMQEDLIKMRQAAAQVMASQKQLEAKYKQSQATADDWLRRAELAVQKGEDDLAKEALRRRKAYQETADGLRMQLDQQQKAVDQLLANTRMLEGKLQEAKNKKDTLKARAASAKTSKQIQEMIGSLNTSNSVVAFEKMEEKVLAMEAEAESTALLVGGDKLENKFAALESGTAEPAGHSRVGSRVRKQVLLLTSSTGAQTLYDVRPGMAAAASSSSGSANASSSSGKEAGVSSRISRARAKTAALLNDPNSSQPPPQLFAKWAGLAEPGKQRQRLLVADMDSYAEVIAAEFYTLEVIGDVLGSRAAASSSTQQQQPPPQGATAAEPDVIDVEALQKSAQAVSGRSRAKKSSSVGLLPSTKPSRTKTKRVLAPPPVIASGSTKVTKPAAAVATAGAPTKQAGKTTTVRVKSQAALFTPLRLLQPLVAPLMGGRTHEGSPAAAEAAATAAVLAKAGSKGGTSKSKRGSTRITKTGGSTRVSKAGSTKVSSSKAGSGTRGRGGTTRTTTKAADLLAALPTETSYGDDGGEGASGTVILSRTMKAAVTRAKNQAAAFADASKLQELIDYKWVDGEERVWFPAAERAAVDLLGSWFTQPQPQGVSKEIAMAELAAAVDAQARKSLKAQFKGKVLLPATPYFDATSLRALLESRVRKGRRLWAKLCDSQPERDWTQEEAAADELALLEWPLWGVWVGWFWDHPSYSPRPGLQGTLVISKTTKLATDGTTIRRNRQSPSPSPSRTDPASPAAAAGAGDSVASSSSSSQLESETVAAVRELLERFSAERREAEATFLAALQQQHAALEATLLRHHEAQASLLMQQHKEQLGARSEEVEWTKQFSKEQIAMLTDFQSKFAKDQIELLRVLSGLQ